MRRTQGRSTEARRACPKTLTHAVLITVGILLRTDGTSALQRHKYQESVQEGWRLARATFDDPSQAFSRNFTARYLVAAAHRCTINHTCRQVKDRLLIAVLLVQQTVAIVDGMMAAILRTSPLPSYPQA